jgi:serine/threonine protein kinase
MLNLDVGDRLGSYKICRKLGEGGMGIVFEAVHKEIERRVAIKVLRPEIAQNEHIVSRLFNEARAVNRIDHPGSVQIHDCVTCAASGVAYLVMEYLHGVTLSARLADSGGQLPEGDTLRIAREIADLFSAAHRKGIIHRDLKPENIMLVPDPATTYGERVKVLDFGIAKLGGAGAQRTGTNLIMGTPRYMSPEQCLGAGHVDEQTDVYSLGVLLFQMLSGTLPFSSQASAELLYQHMKIPPPELLAVAPHVTANTAQLVMSMLQKEKERRPTMAAVATSLASGPQHTLDFGPDQGLAASPPMASLPTGLLTPRGRPTEQLQPVVADFALPGTTLSQEPVLSTSSAPLASAPPALHQRWWQSVLAAGVLAALGLPLQAGLAWRAHSSGEAMRQDTSGPHKRSSGSGSANTARGPLVELLHHTAATVWVSSSVRPITRSARSLVDGDLQTAWNSRPGDLVGASVTFAVPEYARVGHVLLTSGFTKVNEKGDLFTMNHRITRIAVFREGALLGQFDLDPQKRSLQEILINQPGGRFELQVIDVRSGTHPPWREVCISELQVWGWLPSQHPPVKQDPEVGIEGSL